MRNLQKAALWAGASAIFLSACSHAGRLPTPATKSPPTLAGNCARIHPGVGAERMGGTRTSSTIALAKSHDGRVLAYVADADEASLRTIDVAARKEIALTPLKGRAEQVLVLADGRVAVTERFSNALEVLEPTTKGEAPLESRCAVDTDAEPIALAQAPGEAAVLVTSGWGHSLTVFDATNFAPQFKVALARDPRSVVLSDDGTRAFVAHVVEARMSVVDLATPEHAVRIVDLRAHLIAEGSPRDGCQGFALAKVEAPIAHGPAKMIDRIFAPMVSVNSGGGDTSSGYGAESPSEVAEVAVIDASAEKALTRGVRLTSDGNEARACLLPRAAVFDEGSLYVTCLGIDSLVQFDARGLDPSRAELKRWPLAAGPTGVAIDHDGHRAVVWSQFDREVSFVALDKPDEPSRLAVARQSDGLTANVALGRKLFHHMGDKRISDDGRACASCHPDGREDALTWSTPDGTRQTPMLAGRAKDTAPYGWTGANNALTEHIKKTLERLGGEGVELHEIAALADYVATIAAPNSRVIQDLTRAQLVTHGRELFESAGACSSCHDASHAFADGVRHVVGFPSAEKKAESFDTPSLRFVSGTAPYFHDGRYRTLDDVLMAPDHAMGGSNRLSRQDRAALVAFMETL